MRSVKVHSYKLNHFIFQIKDIAAHDCNAVHFKSSRAMLSLPNLIHDRPREARKSISHGHLKVLGYPEPNTFVLLQWPPLKAPHLRCLLRSISQRLTTVGQTPQIYGPKRTQQRLRSPHSNRKVPWALEDRLQDRLPFDKLPYWEILTS